MVLLSLVLVGLKGQSNVNPTSNCGSITCLNLRVKRVSHNPEPFLRTATLSDVKMCIGNVL
jgi:hypothetical protein